MPYALNNLRELNFSCIFRDNLAPTRMEYFYFKRRSVLHRVCLHYTAVDPPFEYLQSISSCATKLTCMFDSQPLRRLSNVHKDRGICGDLQYFHGKTHFTRNARLLSPKRRLN